MSVRRPQLDAGGRGDAAGHVVVCARCFRRQHRGRALPLQRLFEGRVVYQGPELSCFWQQFAFQ